MNVSVVGRMRFHAYQGSVMQSVVAAFKFDDLVPTSRGAGEAYGVHGSLRPTIAKAKHLNRKTITDLFRQLPLHVVRHAEHRSGLQPLSHGFHDGRVAVSGHERAETEVVIDVVVAVEIAEMRALPFLYKDRIWVVVAVGAGNSQRNAFQVAFVSLGGLRRTSLESIELFLQFGVHRVLQVRLRPCRPLE